MRRIKPIRYPRELIWAIDCLFNYYVPNDREKVEWRACLRRDHIYHPIRVVFDWLDGEEIPDEEETIELMLAAAKATEEHETVHGDLTEDEVFNARVEEEVTKRLAKLEENKRAELGSAA
jgi:hypothetical protein